MGLTEHLLRTASLFITTPLMVKWLGNVTYGYWLTAMSVLSYFNLLDLGMSFGTTRFMAQAVGARDNQRQAVIYRVATTHFRRTSMIIGLGSALSFILMPFLVSQGHELSTQTLLLATLPAGLSMALRFLWRVPQLLLRAWVRHDLIALAAIIRVAFQSTVLMLLLPQGGGIILVGVLHALSDLLELTLQNHFSKRLPPFHHEKIEENESAAGVRKELSNFTRDVVVGSIGDGVRAGVGPQVTGFLIGLNMVPIYAMGMRLITMAEDVVNSLFGGTLLSIFGQLHGGAETERLRREFARIIAITSGFGAAAVGGLILFGKAFLRRWLGEKFDGAYEVMVVLSVPYGLYFMQYPSLSLLFTLGYQKYMMWLRCASGLLAGICAISFGLVWGFKGVAWGPAVEMSILYAVAFPLLVHKAIGIPWQKYAWNLVMWPAMKGLALPLLAGWIMRPWITPDYSRIITCSAIYAFTMVISVPLLLLDAEGREALMAALWKKRA